MRNSVPQSAELPRKPESRCGRDIPGTEPSSTALRWREPQHERRTKRADQELAYGQQPQTAKQPAHTHRGAFVSEQSGND